MFWHKLLANFLLMLNITILLIMQKKLGIQYCDVNYFRNWNKWVLIIASYFHWIRSTTFYRVWLFSLLNNKSISIQNSSETFESPHQKFHHPSHQKYNNFSKNNFIKPPHTYYKNKTKNETLRLPWNEAAENNEKNRKKKIKKRKAKQKENFQMNLWHHFSSSS